LDRYCHKTLLLQQALIQDDLYNHYTIVQVKVSNQTKSDTKPSHDS